MLRTDIDAVVRVDAVTYLRNRLHILKRNGPTATDGRILGHEAVGTVESVGAGVKRPARRKGPGLVHHVVWRMSAILGSRPYSSAHTVAVDLAAMWLEVAKQLGADITVNNE